MIRKIDSSLSLEETAAKETFVSTLNRKERIDTLFFIAVLDLEARKYLHSQNPDWTRYLISTLYGLDKIQEVFFSVYATDKKDHLLLATNAFYREQPQQNPLAEALSKRFKCSLPQYPTNANREITEGRCHLTLNEQLNLTIVQSVWGDDDERIYWERGFSSEEEFRRKEPGNLTLLYHARTRDFNEIK